jgi:hypothetical protein
VKIFTIGSQSKTLTPTEIEGTKMGDNHSREGKVAFVRIVKVVRGPKRVHHLMFLNKIGSLKPKPNTYMWKGGEPFLSSTTTLGRKMLI